MKILVVDDDVHVLELTQWRLETAGHVVLTRDEPIGTSKMVADTSPDVVILDWHMPALSGDALGRLLASRFDVPVIYQSAAGLTDKDAQDNGGLGWIPKGIRKDTFLERFNDLVAEAGISA